MLTYTEDELLRFVEESNRIEGLYTIEADIAAHEEFFSQPNVAPSDLERLVFKLQPGAVLRHAAGLDVVVGDHRPPPGGSTVVRALHLPLTDVSFRRMPPWQAHRAYESLHPFTDGNGRSGRALWAWQMLHHDHHPGIRLGFLHAFYYQTLAQDDGDWFRKAVLRTELQGWWRARRLRRELSR